MRTVLRKLHAIVRRLRTSAAEPAALPRAGRALDPERQKHLARLRDETLARVTFGQG